MQQVTIIPTENILSLTFAGLEWEYVNTWKKTSNFYYKLALKDKEQCELTEAFIKGFSELSIRDIRFYCGRSFRIKDGENLPSLISSSNLHNLVKVA